MSALTGAGFILLAGTAGFSLLAAGFACGFAGSGGFGVGRLPSCPPGAGWPIGTSGLAGGAGGLAPGAGGLDPGAAGFTCACPGMAGLGCGCPGAAGLAAGPFAVGALAAGACPGTAGFCGGA